VRWYTPARFVGCEFNNQASSDLSVNNKETPSAACLFEIPYSCRLTSAQVQLLSPSVLAYVGDVVYELYIRTYYLMPPRRLQTYHNQVVAQVRAESQALHLRSLEPYLTPPEQEILRRGRNAASKGPKRVAPEIYQQATSLETLIGYLYLTDPKRLVELLSQLDSDLS
jgi:ribonuclease III family protein